MYVDEDSRSRAPRSKSWSLSANQAVRTSPLRLVRSFVGFFNKPLSALQGFSKDELTNRSHIFSVPVKTLAAVRMLQCKPTSASKYSLLWSDALCPRRAVGSVATNTGTVLQIQSLVLSFPPSRSKRLSSNNFCLNVKKRSLFLASQEWLVLVASFALTTTVVGLALCARQLCNGGFDWCMVQKENLKDRPTELRESQRNAHGFSAVFKVGALIILQDRPGSHWWDRWRPCQA